jgi:thiamine-phosphate pyrophosphorylase
MAQFPGGVYAITPETADTEHLLMQVEAALAGGVSSPPQAARANEATRHRLARVMVCIVGVLIECSRR